MSYIKKAEGQGVLLISPNVGGIRLKCSREAVLSDIYINRYISVFP